MALLDDLVIQLRAAIQDIPASGEAEEFTDDQLRTALIEQAVPDVLGKNPLVLDSTTIPPTLSDNEYWIPTYDFNAAAASIWLQRMTRCTGDYNLNVDGVSLSRDQLFQHCEKMHSYYNSRSMIRSGAPVPGFSGYALPEDTLQ